jgi:deoxycytidine triphosphate deaminase
MTTVGQRRKFDKLDLRTREWAVILNDSSIKERKLVRNANEGQYRACSYDLTVGSVITPEGDVVDEHALKPQGVVKVVSAEIVDVPSNLTGYVHVKTGLCNEGVLALNIGIVDPGFSGPLQSTLINFGKNLHRLHKGSVFGRITFHEQMPSNGQSKSVERTIEQVKTEAKSHVDKYLAEDFLNFSKTVKKAAKKAAGEYRNTLLYYAPALALLLTIFTFVLNFSNMSRMESYINVKDRTAELEDRREMAAKISELEKNRDELSEEVKQLKEQIKITPVEPKPALSK